MMARKLQIFDFDDTLVKSENRIKIVHDDNTVSYLTPLEYSSYSSRPGDQFDYTSFHGPLINPKIIPAMFRLFSKALKSNNRVVILTARTSLDPVKKFLEPKVGTTIPVIALKSPRPEDTPRLKAQWIEREIQTGKYDWVDMFDDSLENLEAVYGLRSKYPNTKIRTYLIKSKI